MRTRTNITPDMTRFIVGCVNPDCPALQMDCAELDDWLTQHGRMRFYIPEHNPDSYSKMTDVYGTFEKGEYEYYHMESICCSLCDAGVEVFDHTPQPMLDHA